MLPAGGAVAGAVTGRRRSEPSPELPTGPVEDVYPPAERPLPPAAPDKAAKKKRYTSFDEAVADVLGPEETAEPSEPAAAPAETTRGAMIPDSEVAVREFLEEDDARVDAVASLPDNPTRTQFAEATGQPRMRVRQNAAQRAEAVAVARQMQQERPSEATGGRSFLDVLDMPEEQKSKLLVFPEAEERIRQELGGMTKWDIAKRFGIPKTKRNRVLSKNRMIDQIIRDRVAPYQSQEVIQDVVQEGATDEQVVQEAEAAQAGTQGESTETVVSSATGEESSRTEPPPQLLGPAAQEYADKLEQEYGDDLDALISLAESPAVNVKLPKKGTKARKELTAKSLREQISVAMTTAKGGTVVRPPAESDADTPAEPVADEPISEPAQPTGAEAPPTRTTSVAKKTPYNVAPKKLRRAIKEVRRALKGYEEENMPIEVMEAQTDEQKDAVAIMQSLGQEVVFIKTDKEGISSGPSWKDAEGNTQRLLLIDVNSSGDALWRLVGHELSHALGQDRLLGLFGKKRLREALRAYAGNWSEAYVKSQLYEKDGTTPTELGYREGAAQIIGEFWTSESFRNELAGNSPGLFKRLLDMIVNAMSKVAPLRDKASQAILNSLKAEQRRFERQWDNNKQGRPSKDDINAFNLKYRVDQMVDSWAQESGVDLTDQDRQEWVDSIVKEVREKHDIAWDAAKIRNEARAYLRQNTGHNKSSLASSVANKGRDYSNMDVKWDVWGERARDLYPEAFTENADRGDDLGGIAYDLVASGDEQIPGYSEDLDLIDSVARDLLYAEPANEADAAQQRLEFSKKNWTAEDQQYYDDLVAKAVSEMNKNLPEGATPLTKDSPEVINTALDEFMMNDDQADVPFTRSKKQSEPKATPQNIGQVIRDIIDADPDLKKWVEKQRYLNRANQGRTMSERLMILKLSHAHGPPAPRPQTVATMAAEARVAKDPNGVQKEVLEKIRKNKTWPIPRDVRKLEEETAIADELLRKTVLEALMSDNEQAIEDAYDINAARTDLRTEVARTLAHGRDPLLSGDPRTQRKTRLLKKILDRPTKEDSKELMRRLKELDITMDDLESALEDELALINLLRRIDQIAPPQGGRLARTSAKLFEWYSNSLFGWTSIGSNIVSNMAMTTQVLGPEKFIEATVNDLIRVAGVKVRGASLGELKYVAHGIRRGMAPAWVNLVRSWRMEDSALAHDLGIISQHDKFERMLSGDERYAIKGLKGRLVRSMGWRPNIALDDFNKTIVAYGQASAHAYRRGRSLRLKGDDMARFMEMELRDMASPAWQLAYIDAQEATFSQEGNQITQWAKQLGSTLRSGSLNPMKFVAPFVNFPINTMEMVAARLPLIGAIAPMYDIATNKTPRTNLGKVAARQIVGLVAYLALEALAMSRDDDDRPFITGSADLRYNYRALQYRTAPPMSVLIGDTYYSYSRIEPFVTLTAMFVDAAHSRAGGRSRTGSDQFLPPAVGRQDLHSKRRRFD